MSQPALVNQPIVMRSLFMLETASELVRERGWVDRQAQIRLRAQSAGEDWSTVLFASDGPEGIEMIANRSVQMAIINPANLLGVAARGTPPFRQPVPLRTVTVIPSYDRLGLAVDASTGLKTLSDLRTQRYPLRLSLRGGRPDHSIHVMLDHVLASVGTSLSDIKSWGGQILYDPYPPNVAGVERGERDAVFDEALHVWGPRALEVGMRLLPIDEPALQRLEAMGYRRARDASGRHETLDKDLPTLDFSGWPVYTHAEVPDATVRSICSAIERAHGRIPWQGEGALPLDRMCSDTPEAPVTVPLHPAAEQYWRERGYLS